MRSEYTFLPPTTLQQILIIRVKYRPFLHGNTILIDLVSLLVYPLEYPAQSRRAFASLKPVQPFEKSRELEKDEDGEIANEASSRGTVGKTVGG